MELPSRFGRYQIERLLGRGGMGAVFLARQVDLGRAVVVKVIARAEDSGLLERFRREAQAAARIDSDNVVKVYETGRGPGDVPFIAMEYVEGRSAAELVQLSGRLEPHAAATIALGAARGLKAAHDAGVVHRDVKPGNLLVARDGRVKVADFGIARLPGSGPGTPLDLTAAGALIGTPYYMAPEQAGGLDIDGRADVYALGATFYELLTGQVPFKGATPIETIALRQRRDPVPPSQLVSGLPAAYDRVCLALLARDPAQRPVASRAVEMLKGLVTGAPSEVLAALVTGAPGAPTVAPTTGGTTPLARPATGAAPIAPLWRRLAADAVDVLAMTVFLAVFAIVPWWIELIPEAAISAVLGCALGIWMRPAGTIGERLFSVRLVTRKGAKPSIEALTVGWVVNQGIPFASFVTLVPRPPLRRLLHDDEARLMAATLVPLGMTLVEYLVALSGSSLRDRIFRTRVIDARGLEDEGEPG